MRRRRTLHTLFTLIAGMALGATLLPAFAAPLTDPAAPTPIPRIAIVARADNPVDALAAGAFAGAVGGAMYLTDKDTLHPEAEAGIGEFGPGVIIIAGGPGAVSDTVEQQLESAFPSASVIRVAGSGRHGTARAISNLYAEYGAIRPVVAGGQVLGNVWVGGTLSAERLQVDGADVATHKTGLTAKATCGPTDWVTVGDFPQFFSNAGRFMNIDTGGAGVGHWACSFDLPEGASPVSVAIHYWDGEPNGELTMALLFSAGNIATKTMGTFTSTMGEQFGARVSEIIANPSYAATAGTKVFVTAAPKTNAVPDTYGLGVTMATLTYEYDGVG